MSTKRLKNINPSSSFITFLIILLLRILENGFVSAGKLPEKLIEQRFAMEPQDQTAIVGARVTLPCRVVTKMGMLQVSFFFVVFLLYS